MKKTLLVTIVAAGALTLIQGVSAQNGAALGTRAPATKTAASGGCAGCAQKGGAKAVPERTVPGTGEAVLVGRIENLIPVGVLAALGCEKCTGEAVTWALQQGSSTEDIERALRALEAMQKLDCFKKQFGADAAAQLEKPLAAARTVLQQAVLGPAE